MKRITVEWPCLNDGYCYKSSISKPDHFGLELLDYLSIVFSHSGSRQDWEERLSLGQVKINDKVVPSIYKIRCGDECIYQRQPWQEPHAPNFVDVMYEDEHVIAICKPSGLQVMPAGPYFQRTALEILKRHFSLHGKTPTPVHRLGRGTSGVLLCARSSHARRVLSEAMTHATLCMPSCLNTSSNAEPNISRRGKLLKIYRALVTGIIQHQEGEVDAAIGLVDYKGVLGGLHIACPLEQGGKPALSSFKVLHRNFAMNCTLVDVEIFSGRPHQIRIHMAYIGHPLLGDPVYGFGGLPKEGINGGIDGTATSSRPGDCGKYLLHSHILEIPHPSFIVPKQSRSTQHDGTSQASRDIQPFYGDDNIKSQPCIGYVSDGWLLLCAPLPNQLLTPLELTQSGVLD